MVNAYHKSSGMNFGALMLSQGLFMTRNPAFIAAFFAAMIITACFTAKGAGPAKLQVTGFGKSKEGHAVYRYILSNRRVLRLLSLLTARLSPLYASQIAAQGLQISYSGMTTSIGTNRTNRTLALPFGGTATESLAANLHLTELLFICQRMTVPTACTEESRVSTSGCVWMLIVLMKMPRLSNCPS